MKESWIIQVDLSYWSNTFVSCPIFIHQRAQAALQAVNAVQTGGMSLGGVEAGGVSGPSPVLRVVVENLFYPVTLDVLHQVDPCFSQYCFCFASKALPLV